MDPQPLGKTNLCITRLGFGAFKIGRNVGTKYPNTYDLPDDATADALLNGVLDLGINYIDTAPAYGISESRVGTFLSHRNDEFVVSTKVGETFENNASKYDFSKNATLQSLNRSRRRLNRDVLDIVFVHSDGNDLNILNDTSTVETLHEQKSIGNIQAIGFSGKTVEGNTAALDWADVIMVEYNTSDMSHEDVLAAASKRGVGVIVKKGLGSGHLPPQDSIKFVLKNDAVDSLVVGGLNIDHLRSNVEFATSVDAS